MNDRIGFRKRNDAKQVRRFRTRLIDADGGNCAVLPVVRVGDDGGAEAPPATVRLVVAREVGLAVEGKERAVAVLRPAAAGEAGIGQRGGVDHAACRKRLFPSSISYTCPEPVLIKLSGFSKSKINGSRKGVYICPAPE